MISTPFQFFKTLPGPPEPSELSENLQNELKSIQIFSKNCKNRPSPQKYHPLYLILSRFEQTCFSLALLVLSLSQLFSVVASERSAQFVKDRSGCLAGTTLVQTLCTIIHRKINNTTTLNQKNDNSQIHCITTVPV